ncbi:MAG: hypothetical protein H7249_05875 [Chitinophagaceae bacterium]|nr:hypothetical protein [Oligoflexus sp.]
MTCKIGGFLLFAVFTLGEVLHAAPIEGHTSASTDLGLIHQATLLPSGVYRLRRQKMISATARALPQKKPRRKLNPDSMAASELSVGR